MDTPAKIVVSINANLQWRYTIGKGGNYVAVCDPLKITLQAKNPTELMEDASDVLNAMFHDLLSSNELDRFLRDHGWTAIGQIPARPENVRFVMPIFLAPAMAQPNDSQKHVPQ
jgi:predicted RNase H-like HicB family nuclease